MLRWCFLAAPPEVGLSLAMLFKAAAINGASYRSGALIYLIDPLGLVDCAVDLRIYLLEAGFDAILLALEELRIE